MSVLAVVAAVLAGISIALNLWQWWLGFRFHVRKNAINHQFAPPVSVLKPLKDCDAETERCLESWFQQEYPARLQLLFGVASAQDPVCAIVEKLRQKYADRHAELVIASPVLGPNGKVSTLCHLSARAEHEHLVISDADVSIEKKFLSRFLPALREKSIGLVNCFYILANPTSFATRLEAIAVNADFWTSVLQGIRLRRMDFALGAVMATRRSDLARIGGFERLIELLADDYQLGNQIAKTGKQVIISPLRVECREENHGTRTVWRRQLRWARTLRVCRPAGYFFSVLGNGTLWPTLAFAAGAPGGGWLLGIGLGVRMLGALSNYRKLTGRAPAWAPLLAPLKDLAQLVFWMLAFSGNKITWHNQRFQVDQGGKLTPLA